MVVCFISLKQFVMAQFCCLPYFNVSVYSFPNFKDFLTCCLDHVPVTGQCRQLHKDHRHHKVVRGSECQCVADLPLLTFFFQDQLNSESWITELTTKGPYCLHFHLPKCWVIYTIMKHYIQYIFNPNFWHLQLSTSHSEPEVLPWLRRE